LIVTEMASNLIKHAQRGHIVLTAYDPSVGGGGEAMSLDSGPGIANLSRALEDGYSTAGTVGGGLGIMRRQSDVFEIFTRPEKGTAVMARVGAKPTIPSPEIGVVMAPFPGEDVCGDAWAFAETSSGPTLMNVDGSGHGFHAESAAKIAVKVFEDNADEPCAEIIKRIHRALQATRGAAVAIARIDQAARKVRYVGVGNITGALIDGGVIKRMVSHNGIAGAVAPNVREFEYPYTDIPTVVLHSDGLTAKWDISAYPGLGMSHPSLIAGVLFRDFRRGRDDASVVALRVA